MNFFTINPYKFEKSYYLKNEGIFFKLVHNTIKNNELEPKFNIPPINFIDNVLENIFNIKSN